MVERFCDEAVWLDKGVIRGDGDPRRVIHAYVNDVEKAEETLLATGDRRVRAAARGGDGSEPMVVSDQAIATEAPPEDMFRAAQGRWGPRPGRDHGCHPRVGGRRVPRLPLG